MARASSLLNFKLLIDAITVDTVTESISYDIWTIITGLTSLAGAAASAALVAISVTAMHPIQTLGITCSRSVAAALVATVLVFTTITIEPRTVFTAGISINLSDVIP